MQVTLMTAGEMISRIINERPETLSAEKWLRIALYLCDKKNPIKNVYDISNINGFSCGLCKEYYNNNDKNICKKCPYARKFKSCNNKRSTYNKFINSLTNRSVV